MVLCVAGCGSLFPCYFLVIFSLFLVCGVCACGSRVLFCYVCFGSVCVCSVLFFFFITSHHITSHHVTSHHITSLTHSLTSFIHSLAHLNSTHITPRVIVHALTHSLTHSPMRCSLENYVVYNMCVPTTRRTSLSASTVWGIYDDTPT